MTFTFTLTVMQIYTLGFFSFIAILLYIFSKTDGDDHISHIRHDIEMKKEWIKMLDKGNENAIR